MTGFYRVVAFPAAQRGRVLSAALIPPHLTTNDIGSILSFLGSSIVPQYGVDVYQLVYETLDPLGGRTQASGIIAVPQNPDRPLPLVSYQHGTLVLDSEAPSQSALGERVIGVAFASTGYAAVMPDYLGLGDSPGLHPYHHARSEATACVDLLRAARTWCATNGVALTGQLFLCGYSEGGHVTMALHRELETYHTDEFTITASAPMAGAYDLSGTTLEDALSGRRMPNPYYFALLLAAYEEVYHFTDSLAGLLAPPYETTLPPLLTGANDSDQINAAMTNVVTNVFKADVVSALQNHPDHPLRVALRDNDLYRWTPRAPMRLYHCGGDEDVVIENSVVARDSFKSRGAPVDLVEPLATGTHGECVLPSLQGAKAWFDSLRQ
jgi:dienelactone hydrolase